jgi:type IV secretory pathway VirB4 component
MSNDSIGAMYPFASNALQDPQGVFLGYESYSGEPFYFDLKIKQDYRNSNVCLVCAKTGGGKTYTVSKICNWFKVIGEKSGMKQYIVDPLGDYSGFLVNYNNVARIDMTDAKNGLINPLQILDEEKDLTTHASEFVVFLSMIAKKTFSAKIERLIIESLLELYSKFKITDTSKQIVDENKEIHRVFEYSRFKSNQWPTTNDFYQFLFKKYRSCPGGSEENDLINIM